MLEFIKESDIGGCKVPLRNKETGQFIGCLVGYKTQSTPSMLRSFKQMDPNFAKRNNKAVATNRDFRQFEDTAFNPRKFQYAEQIRDPFLRGILDKKFRDLLATKYDLSNPIDSAQFSRFVSSAEFKKLLASIDSSVNLTSTKDREEAIYNIYTNYTKLSRLSPKEISETTDRIYPDSSLENNSINRINRINTLRQKFPELGELERMAQMDIGDLGRKEAFITSNVEPLRKALLQRLSKMSPEQAASLVNGKVTYENIPDSLIKEIGDSLASLQQLVYDKDLDSQIIRSSQMSRPGVSEDGLDIGYLGIGANFKSPINDPLKSALWHLAGHKIQFDNKIVRDFKYETEGNTSIYPLEGFGIPVRPDNHGLPYVGRDYDSGINEVLPIGLGALANGSQLYEMLRMEPGVITTTLLALDSLEAPSIDLDLSKLKELDPDAIRKFKQLEKDNPIEYLKMLEAYKKSNKVSEVTSANLLPVFSDDEKRLVLGDLSDKFGLLSEAEYDTARKNLIEALSYFDPSLQGVSYVALKSMAEDALLAVLPSQQVALGIKQGDELEMVQSLAELVISQNPKIKEEYDQKLLEEVTKSCSISAQAQQQDLEASLVPEGLLNSRQVGMEKTYDRNRARMERDGILSPVSHAPKSSPGYLARQRILDQSDKYDSAKSAMDADMGKLRSWVKKEMAASPASEPQIKAKALEYVKRLDARKATLEQETQRALQEALIGREKPDIPLRDRVDLALQVSSTLQEKKDSVDSEVARLREETKTRKETEEAEKEALQKARAEAEEEKRKADEEQAKLNKEIRAAKEYMQSRTASGATIEELDVELKDVVEKLKKTKQELESRFSNVRNKQSELSEKEALAKAEKKRRNDETSQKLKELRKVKDELEEEATREFDKIVVTPEVVTPKLRLGAKNTKGEMVALSPDDRELLERYQDGFYLFSSMMSGYDLSSQEGTMNIDRTEKEGKANARSFYSSSTNQVNLAPNVDVGTVVHEWGHWAETTFPNIRERISGFLERRTRGEDNQKLSDLTGNRDYKDTEITKPDAFLAEYMGKYYKDGSEIFSMGLEYMVRDPIKFAKEDPDMFDFIYNTMSNYSDPEAEALSYAEAQKIETARRLERKRRKEEELRAKLKDATQEEQRLIMELEEFEL